MSRLMWKAWQAKMKDDLLTYYAVLGHIQVTWKSYVAKAARLQQLAEGEGEINGWEFE